MHAQATHVPIIERGPHVGCRQGGGVECPPMVAQHGLQPGRRIEAQTHLHQAALSLVAMHGHIGQQLVEHQPEGRSQGHWHPDVVGPGLQPLEESGKLGYGAVQGLLPFERWIHRCLRAETWGCTCGRRLRRGPVGRQGIVA
ncbi:hypothetical protein D3C72_1979640 [compost metagenome]